MPMIRPMRPADIAAVDPLLMAAYENQSSFAPRLSRLLALEPEGWFIAEEEGRVLGTGGATITGKIAYLGLVAVDPAARRRGIATAVTVRVLEFTAARNCETVLLDASDAGRPVYERLGFLAEELVGLWKRPEGKKPSLFEAKEADLRISTLSEEGSDRGIGADAIPEGLLALDALAWGGDRSRVLASFMRDDPSLVALVRTVNGRLSGFAILQRESGILGPWVAKDAAAARALLAWALDQGDATANTAYLPAANEDGARLLGEAGFSLLRSLTHMRLGKRLDPLRRRLVYSQANFAQG